MCALADVGANLRQAAGVTRVLAAHHDHAVAAVGKCGCCLLALARGCADGVDHAQFLHARGDGGHNLGQVLRGLGSLHNQTHLALERQRVRIGGAAHDLRVITGMAQDALNLGVARLAHDDHAVASRTRRSAATWTFSRRGRWHRPRRDRARERPRSPAAPRRARG